MGAGAGRRGHRHRREKGERAPLQGNATDAAAGDRRLAAPGERKAILGQRRRAPSRVQLAAGAGPLDRRDRRHRRLPDRSANTVGAQLVKAMPGEGGLNAGQMLAGGLKALFLLNNEPEFDSAAGAERARWASLRHGRHAEPFKANLDISDVLLPIAPWTETPGTFVNAEGRVQGFHAVVKPLGEARPAWKVLRVLGNMLGLPGFEYESASEVLADARGADRRAAAAGAGQAAVQQDGQGRLAGRHRREAGRGAHLPARFHRAPRGLAAALRPMRAPRNSRR